MTTRDDIRALVHEWLNAADAPTGYITERLEPLLDRFAIDVMLVTETRARSEVLRDVTRALDDAIAAEEWSDLYTDGLAAARELVHELAYDPLTAPPEERT